MIVVSMCVDLVSRKREKDFCSRGETEIVIEVEIEIETERERV